MGIGVGIGDEHEVTRSTYNRSRYWFGVGFNRVYQHLRLWESL
jgi:hypothetical protein